MNIRLRKWALAGLLLTLCTLAAYWYWSPFLAMRSMHSAARANDADAFSQHVDYPRVRASLKAQLSAIMAAKTGGSGDSTNPFAAIGARLGMAMVDKVVDVMVSPETVMRGMRSGQFGPHAPTPESRTDPDASGAENQKQQKKKWTYLREGADRLIAYPEETETSKGKNVGIVFERSGFASWKVTELRLPRSAIDGH